MNDFLTQNKGKTPITRILIANNGMAAVKCIRSLRRWAYDSFGCERILSLIAMASNDDLIANAEFIRMADQYVSVPGGSSNNNYANVYCILDVAKRLNVHAVWVGWGFASENPVLADLLIGSCF